MNIAESGEQNHKNFINGNLNYERKFQEDQSEAYERRHRNCDRHYERPGNCSPNCRRKGSYNSKDFENEARNGNDRGSYTRRGYFQNNRYPPQREFNQHNSYYRQQDENFRQRNFRKPTYQGRYHNDREYSRPRFFQKPQFRGRPFNYRQDRQPNEFKVPKNMNNFQNKRRHLKYLRKTAAECAATKPGTFVYKPGMIGLLRPSTPMNTTQFLSKKHSFEKGSYNEENDEKQKVSPKMNSKQNSNEIDRECFSVCQERRSMTHYGMRMLSRTPEPKHSPLNLSSNFDSLDYPKSENDVIFDEECISGTMEGLASFHMFDSDPAYLNHTNNHQEHKFNEINLNSILHNSNQIHDCSCIYKEKYERLRDEVIALKDKLKLPDDCFSFLENH